MADPSSSSRVMGVDPADLVFYQKQVVRQNLSRYTGTNITSAAWIAFKVIFFKGWSGIDQTNIIPVFHLL